MRYTCRLRETGWAKFGYFLCHFKMVAPRALVFRPLVKGNEDSGNEIDPKAVYLSVSFGFHGRVGSRENDVIYSLA